jgi:hypothetical protein
MDFEGISCSLDGPRAGKRLTDLDVILPDLPVQDFVWTWYSELLLQGKVLEMFKNEDLTGFGTKPVKARFKSLAKTPPRLSELVVTGWGGVVPVESGIKLITSCPECGYTHYTDITDPTKFKASQWDGSDFFMIWPLPKFIFITPRVAAMIKNHNLTGAIIQNIREVIKDIETAKSGFSPGRLSDWMPDARAREIGEPLGIYWPIRRPN